MLIRSLARSSATPTSPFTLIRQYHATSLSSAPTLPNSPPASPIASTLPVPPPPSAASELKLIPFNWNWGTDHPKQSFITKENITIFILYVKVYVRGYMLAAAAPPFTLPKFIPIPNRLSSPFSTISVCGLQSGPLNASTYDIPSPPINWGGYFVKTNYAYVIERFGEYHPTLSSGIHILIPIVDRIAYVYCLKDQAIPIRDIRAATRDFAPLTIEALIYIMELACSTMRAQLTLDEAHVQREIMGQKFMETINGAAKDWGVKCCCYMIMDIRSPATLKETIMTASISDLKQGGSFYAGVVFMAMARIIGRLIAELIGWIVLGVQKPSGSEDFQATKDKDDNGDASGTEDSQAIEDKDDKGDVTGK